MTPDDHIAPPAPDSDALPPATYRWVANSFWHSDQ